MNTSQQIFALFYAIMWGTLANVFPKWKAFDWALVTKRYCYHHAFSRGILSLLILNVFPIGYFILVFLQLGECQWELKGTFWIKVIKLLVVMIQPFFLFGIYGYWVSIIKKLRKRFYPPWLDKELYPNLSEADLDPQYSTWKAASVYTWVPIVLFFIAGSLLRSMGG